MDKTLAAPILATAFLLGCSTPPPPATPVAQLLPLPPVKALERDLPFEPPELGMGRVCKLGTSCMDLDQRPFEICLVGGAKRCVDKAKDPVPVRGPKASEPEGPIPISHR